MPAVPSCLFEPIWVEFASLLGDRPEFAPGHPWGCHRRRISDRVVFEHVVDALVHGSGYERIASRACSDRTIRRRLAQWAAAGIAQQAHRLALAAYDKIVGLQLDDLSADGCLTKAPCGGDKAGPSPVDRRKGGMKRSTVVDATGVPLGIVTAGGNRHDSPLLPPTLASAAAQVGGLPSQAVVRLDAAYDSHVTRDVLTSMDLTGDIAHKGQAAPIQVGRRWVVERTNSWGNNYGKLRRMTDRNGDIVDFYIFLAAALITVRRLIQAARTRYRWHTRPSTRRLK